ncbi:hypothetical protein AGLY_000748 [Aphis glycines]|uniref:Transmembrane protein n=1 Tax=Aphis glycines TaxID=307491 RepID=A0A6G0U7U7_APHGL|nr:hypothetical protein AGLY_000748 [Aphis glycines]
MCTKWSKTHINKASKIFLRLLNFLLHKILICIKFIQLHFSLKGSQSLFRTNLKITVTIGQNIKAIKHAINDNHHNGPVNATIRLPKLAERHIIGNTINIAKVLFQNEFDSLICAAKKNIAFHVHVQVRYRKLITLQNGHLVVVVWLLLLNLIQLVLFLIDLGMIFVQSNSLEAIFVLTNENSFDKTVIILQPQQWFVYLSSKGQYVIIQDKCIAFFEINNALCLVDQKIRNSITQHLQFYIINYTFVYTLQILFHYSFINRLKNQPRVSRSNNPIITGNAFFIISLSKSLKSISSRCNINRLFATVFEQNLLNVPRHALIQAVIFNIRRVLFIKNCIVPYGLTYSTN